MYFDLIEKREIGQLAFTFDSPPGSIPTFPAFFFKAGGYTAPSIDLSNEITICESSPVTLNPDRYNLAHACEWTNIATSEVYTGFSPVLNSPQSLMPDTSYFSLKITETNGCNRYDVVRVITLPSPAANIKGSKSVCPGVNALSYWLDHAIETDLHWSAEGGEIIAGQGTDSILVNWGSSNVNAGVTIVANYNNGCQVTGELPVKIFRQLDTEKPNGTDTLNCFDTSYYYSIAPTNGSRYNWQILNGEILEGQCK